MIRATIVGFSCLAGITGVVGVVGMAGETGATELADVADVTESAPPKGTPPPAEGWANHAPTVVERVVDREETQLLEVAQGELRTWIRVPSIGAAPGDYVLLGQGTLRRDVEIAELGRRVPSVVDIAHAQVVDYDTARRAVRSASPQDAVSIGRVYADLDALADDEVVVHGTVVKAPSAIGWHWVHIQDGSGDPSSGTHDLTVKTSEPVTVGQRVAFRGTLRKDVDLGFGYRYQALVEGGVRLSP